jgi:protease I
MAKIACLLTSMFEDTEFTEPAKAFKEAGHEVVGHREGKRK